MDRLLSKTENLRLREGLHLMELHDKHVNLQGFQQSQSGVFAPLNRIRRVANVRPKVATVVFVAPISRLAVGFSVLSERKERPPCFAVLAFDLLDRRHTEDTAVATSVLTDFPYIGVLVGVVPSTLTRPPVSFAHKIV